MNRDIYLSEDFPTTFFYNHLKKWKNHDKISKNQTNKSQLNKKLSNLKEKPDKKISEKFPKTIRKC